MLLSYLCSVSVHGDVLVSEGTNISADVSRVDGRVVMDLLGSIWILPADGGRAEIVSDNLLPARRPRWSPDGERILYQTQTGGFSQIWAASPDGGDSSRLSDGKHVDRDPDWHPNGERIVFSSARGTTGFDIWETDLPTGLSWRLESRIGDETEPAWSEDGHSLTYIWRQDARWSLMLRRRGRPAVALVESDEPLAAPSWRPDGSLITFLKQRDGRLSLEMVILSDPPLVRTAVEGEDFFVSPVSWLTRSRLYYTANGQIRTRDFDAWESTSLPFTAGVGQAKPRTARAVRKQELPLVDTPSARLVVRAARIFDGSGNGYRYGVDVLIDGPRIAAVAKRREWPDATILNLDNATLLPGFIDSYASVFDGDRRSQGAELLSYGVTTLITNDEWPDHDPGLWEGEQSPGPRVLRAGDILLDKLDDGRRYQFVAISSSGLRDVDRRSAVAEWQANGIPVLAESWAVGLGVGADLLLGMDSLPTSPTGKQYQDIRTATQAAPVALVSGLADAGTPGLSALFQSRQARVIRRRVRPLRRFSSVPSFAAITTSIMLGSKPSGLPPGLALHAEMRALAAAGLSGDAVLRAASSSPANVLGLDGQIGRIADGALADLVLVSGDPLTKIADTMNIVAIVRNGRFYSLVSLLERASEPLHVE